MSRPVIVTGAGGHARVVADALCAAGMELLGFTDSNPDLKGTQLLGYPVLGDDEVLSRYAADDILLANGIGSVESVAARRRVFEQLRERGYRFVTVVHPKAVIATNVTFGEGAQVMAGAIVQTNAVIDENAIINTRAVVDHDCRVGAHSHIGPGCTLSGSVTVEAEVHIGTGATVIQGVSIGHGALIAAGAVVVGNVARSTRVMGVPARADWHNALVSPRDSVGKTIEKIDAGSMQLAIVVDESKRLLGTVTDGDVRRGLLRGVTLDSNVGEIMNARPTRAHESQNRSDIMTLMRTRSLHQIPVVDDAGVVLGVEVIDELLMPQRRDNWVVLKAGGMGKRLRPLTENVPKPMLCIGDRPILEHILEAFVESGFRRFFVSVNYLSHMIEEHFGDGSRWGVEISYLEEDHRLGTAGALSLLPERPQAPLIVMNGDLLTKVNFAQLVDFHTRHNSYATMCVRKYDYQIPYGVVQLNDHRLVAVEEKPIQQCFVNAGIYVLDPGSLEAIPENQLIDMPDLFDRFLQDGRNVSVFPIREYWIDIGRLEDFERANGDYRPELE